MSRVDLDAIGVDGRANQDTVLALVAEVRASRKVIEAAQQTAKWAQEIGRWHTYAIPLFKAVYEYDQTVGSGE